jgi:hypothetical protein
MTISVVGTASANADSITLPTHAAGDLIALAIYRNDNATQPTFISGWSTVQGGGTNLNFIALVSKIATSSSEVSGTWAGATQMIAVVFRSSKILTLGNSNLTFGNAGVGNIIRYPAIGAGSEITDKWHVGVAGHRSNDTDIEVAPSGMTNRVSIAGGSAGELVWHDTNANSASWPTTDYTLTAGTTAAYRSITCELRETNLDVASGGGIYNPFRPPVFGGG